MQNFIPRCENNIFDGYKLQLVTHSFMNTVSPYYGTPFENFYLVDSTTDCRKFVTNKNELIIRSVVLTTIILSIDNFLNKERILVKLKSGLALRTI